MPKHQFCITVDNCNIHREPEGCQDQRGIQKTKAPHIEETSAVDDNDDMGSDDLGSGE